MGTNSGPPETPRTSQHYRIEGLKRAFNQSPVMPRDASWTANVSFSSLAPGPNLFEILLNLTAIILYLPFSNSKRTFLFGSKSIGRKMVNIIWFGFDLIGFLCSTLTGHYGFGYPSPYQRDHQFSINFHRQPKGQI